MVFYKNNVDFEVEMCLMVLIIILLNENTSKNILIRFFLNQTFKIPLITVPKGRCQSKTRVYDP